MNIQFRNGSGHLEEKPREKALLKISKLARYITERNYEAQVYVDIQRESGSKQSESGWKASIHVDLAGDYFDSSETATTPEKATDLAIKDLKRELHTAKGKFNRSVRRSGGLLNQLFLSGN